MTIQCGSAARSGGPGLTVEILLIEATFPNAAGANQLGLNGEASLTALQRKPQDKHDFTLRRRRISEIDRWER
jgi:hypothetical protein